MPVKEHNSGPRFAIEQFRQPHPQYEASVWRMMESCGKPFLFSDRERAAAFVALLNSTTILGGPKIQYRIVEIEAAAHIVSLTS
jgi:hypothetical protein